MKVCGLCGKLLVTEDAPLSTRSYWLILLAAAVGTTLWVV